MGGSEILMDTREIERGLFLCRKQIPFAIALALTRTAQAAQRAEIGGRGQLQIREGDWTAKGIRIKSATKRTLEAQVGSVDPLMALLATGGTKAKGAHLQAVPAKGGSTTEPLRGPDDLVRLLKAHKLWPKGLVKSRGGFFVRSVRGFQGKVAGSYTSKGNRTRTEKGKTSAILSNVLDHDILFQKTGRPHTAKHKYLDKPAGREVFPSSPIQAVYVFASSSKIPAKWPFEHIIEVVVAERWPVEVEQAITQALWTAR